MKTRFNIEGLDCPNCAAKLAAMIEKRDGITNAKINFLTEKLTVESELAQEELFGILINTAKSFDPGIKISK